MKSIPLLILFVATTAYSKTGPAPRVAAPVAETVEMINYLSYDGSFQCRVPADWKLSEDRNGGPMAMFFGMMSGPQRAQISLAISRYPSKMDSIRTPQQYWQSLRHQDHEPSPLETHRNGARVVYTTHLISPQYVGHGRKAIYMNREDIALIKTPRGMFAISHTAPANAYEKTLTIFDAVVASFTPRP